MTVTSLLTVNCKLFLAFYIILPTPLNFIITAIMNNHYLYKNRLFFSKSILKYPLLNLIIMYWTALKKNILQVGKQGESNKAIHISRLEFLLG